MKKLFSLIELLIVVAIIIILVSLLQPALRKAIEQAHLAVCLSNLKQVTIGFMLFSEDQKYLPQANRGNDITWAPLTREYLSGVGEVFVCPQTRFADGDPIDSYWEKEYGSGRPAEYGYDQDEVRVVRSWNMENRPRFVLAYGVNNNGTSLKKPTWGTGDWGNEAYVNRMANPGKFLMVGDSYTNGVWDGMIDYRGGAWGERIDWGRHSYGAVLGWGDGHAGFEDALDFTRGGPNYHSLSNEEVRKMWNIEYNP